MRIANCDSLFVEIDEHYFPVVFVDDPPSGEP